MVSKNKIAYIRSLHNKNIRLSEGIFLVEWSKSMSEFISSDFDIVEGFFIEDFAKWKEYTFPFQIITNTELNRISTLTSNDCWLLLIKMKDEITPKIKKNEFILVLDRINDPGNLGTIIRICDWYGISQIIASRDTVDCYNPKVLMATMGSFARVFVCYRDLDIYLSKIKWKIYWAYLDGESTHTKNFSAEWGILLIGSEAHGISMNLEKYITDKITIPRFWSAESLNAGIATAVILDRIRGE